MPAITSVVLNDGEATPVAHTFYPIAVEGPVARYEDRASGVAVGYPQLSVSFVRAGKNSKVNRARFSIVYPVLETLGTASASGILPAPTRAYELRANVELLIPTRCTLQDRKNLRQLTNALLGTSVMTSVAENQENVW